MSFSPSELVNEIDWRRSRVKEIELMKILKSGDSGQVGTQYGYFLFCIVPVDIITFKKKLGPAYLKKLRGKNGFTVKLTGFYSKSTKRVTRVTPEIVRSTIRFGLVLRNLPPLQQP